MRIIKKALLKALTVRFPQAAEWLAAFRSTAQAAHWASIVDLRRNYPHADAVTVKSGRTVVVLNACGNKYRFIIAVHYKTKIVFTLRFMTHAEYSKNKWKAEL